MTNTPIFLLASQSPRRRTLLNLFGWPLEVHPANVDETPLPDEAPHAYVRRLAETKARALQAQASPQHLIVAADTIVADAGHMLGKPSSSQAALAMLQQLRGRAHQVHSGVALLDVASGTLLSAVHTSQVHMRAYTLAEMQTYIRSGDPLDKAGAYAIQNRDFHPVERIIGCYASVMGLPLCHLANLLAELGFTPPGPIHSTCQRSLNIHCDFYPQILINER